jgi:hypothetical protein
MKKRTPAEMAEYQLKRRERIAAAPVTPATVTPVTPARKRNTCPSPVTPAAPVVCSGCQEKAVEIARLKAEVERLSARLDVKSVAKDEAEALRQRVISGKINSYGKNRVIGRATL